MSEPPFAAPPARPSTTPEPQVPPRATATLVKDIVGNTQLLVRQELELAKAEVKEGVSGMAQAAGAGAAMGVLAMYLVGFLGLAAGFGLGEVMPLWGAFLVVAGVFLLLIAILGLIARAKAKNAPLPPEQTQTRIQEDLAWARTLIRR